MLSTLLLVPLGLLLAVLAWYLLTDPDQPGSGDRTGCRRRRGQRPRPRASARRQAQPQPPTRSESR